MKRKAPTNKERDQVTASLIDKVFHHEMILSLILEHDKKLNEFVKSRLKEVEQRNKSQDKK